MSLVFLKSETNNPNVQANDHMKPYDWENNFSTPLVLPKDSQVAYISSTMSRDKVINLSDPVANFWMQIGHPELSIPMPIQLNTSPGFSDTWTDVAARLTASQAYLGNTDFMNDGVSGGFEATYSPSTQKLGCNLTQRLQPTIQDVWANRGDSIGSVAAWTAASGKNEQGLVVENGSNAGNAVAAVDFPTLPLGGLWDVGWKRFTLLAGGLPANDAPIYNDDRFSLCRSKTGIKRTCYGGITPDDVGGAVQFKGACSALAFGQSANVQGLPYVAGLNSLQAINACNAAGENYVDVATINGTSAEIAAYPNVVQVRVAGARMYIEIMETQDELDESQTLQFGTWGKCEEQEDVQYTTGNTYSPYNTRVVDQIDIETWLTSALNQPQNTGGQASQPYFNQARLDPAEAKNNHIVFQIKWTTPYTFQVWAGTGFNEKTGKYEGTAVAGGNQYAPGTAYANTYTILYDSKTGGTYGNGLTATPEDALIVPRYFGDLGFCGWIDRRTPLYFRGNFDAIKAYPDTPSTNPPNLTYDLALKGKTYYNMQQTLPTASGYKFFNSARLKCKNGTASWGGIYPAIPNLATTALDFNLGATTAANKGMSDEIPTCVVGELKQAASVANFQKWWRPPTNAASVNNIFVPINVSPDTNIGVILGWIKEADDGMLDWALTTANNVEEYNVVGVAAVGESEIYNSVHIQLTNLPINGRNGMTSSKTSTIAVIHNASADARTTTADERRIYNHYQNEKNFIDLNNVAEMTLNQLRVYISGDNNAPANFLKDKSDVLIMFRQKPAADGGISTQPINKFGLSPASGQTFR